MNKRGLLACTVFLLLLLFLSSRANVALEPERDPQTPLLNAAASPLPGPVQDAGSCAYPLPDGMCVYYGDLHSHTGYSDGFGTPQQAYQSARDNGLDFMATADHGFMLDDVEWQDTLTQARAATEEDVFVALRGYEWTSSWGHINVLNTGDRVVMTDPAYDDLGEFYAWLSDPAQRQGVAQFNHPYYPSGAFDGLRYDPLAARPIRFIELADGDALRIGRYQTALNNGWRVAPTNNSDTHIPNWGERRGRNGLVMAGLTHHNVLEALRNRRIFATQDENMTLVMRAGSHWMGSVLLEAPVDFEVYAYDPDDDIAVLELYQNNQLVKGTTVHDNALTWRFVLPAPSPPGSWWYVKAIQEDKQEAYTSPIWTYSPPAYDVRVRDNLWDEGDVPATDPAWTSPDLWVRQAADGETWHQNPLPGATNTLYARLHNAGTQPLTGVQASFYWADPSLGLTWPEDWHLINAAPVPAPALSPGASAIVSTTWPLSATAPPHLNLMVRASSAQDPAVADAPAKWDNNVAQQDVHILDLGPSPSSLQFYLENPYPEPEPADLRFYSQDFPGQGSLTLHLESGLFNRWITSEQGGHVKGATVYPLAQVIYLQHPIDAVVYGLPLAADERSPTTLVLSAPSTATLALEVTQEIHGQQTGGHLYSTPFTWAPQYLDLHATVEETSLQHTVELTATVLGTGGVPVPDGTPVHFSSTLGTLDSETALTQDSRASVTLDTGPIPGPAIVHATVGDTLTATRVIRIRRTCWARLNADATDYTTVQAAVDASGQPTDTVKIAGYCDHVNTRGGTSQVAYISKSLTLQGGYTATNWITADPVTHPTTLDAGGQGRALFITGTQNITVAKLALTHGNALGLPGGPSGTGAGGGVYAQAATLTLQGNRLQRNLAATGGGLYLANGAALLENNVLADNQALAEGSALYLAGVSARLWHNTIARNGWAGTLGDGSGLYVTNLGDTYSSVALTNTLLVKHPLGLSVTAGNVVRLEATLWGAGDWANGTDWTGNGSNGNIDVGTVNLYQPPAFVAPDAGDYHLRPASPARDAGVGTGPEWDIDGHPRPMGHAPDMGADELRVTFDLAKRASAASVRAGDLLTYTLSLTNTGDVDLHTTVTDTLPLAILPGQASDGQPISPGGTLTWAPVLSAPGGAWTQQVAVTVQTGYAGVLTNTLSATAQEAGPGSAGQAGATIRVVYQNALYLPLLMRNRTGEEPPLCAPQLIAEIDAGPWAQDVALDRSGHRAFVAHAEGVTVIDTQSLAVITATQALTSAYAIDHDADRDRLWVVRRGPDRVLVLDATTYELLAELPTGAAPHSLAYNPANGRVYLTNFESWTVSVYDAETLDFLTELTDVTEPGHLGVNAETNRIYVANHRPYKHVTVIDGATHNSYRISTGLLDAYGLAVDETRNLIYAAAIAQGRIAVIDGAGGQQLGTYEILRRDGSLVPLRALAVNPGVGSQGHLWVISSSKDGGRDEVLLIPVDGFALGTPVPLDLARYPLDGIAIERETHHVWVTSVESGGVSVIQDGPTLCPTPFSTGTASQPEFYIRRVR